MNFISTEKKRTAILIPSLYALLFYFVLVPPIAQDPAYHVFADTRIWGGVPNCLNVISNLAFLGVGFWGWSLYRDGCLIHDNQENYPVYAVFFIGVMLSGFGSAYYHWAPGNGPLVWDRLPMTLSFAAFLVAILSEYVEPGIERRLLYPLVGLGLFSVIYWYLTERFGRGDLRLYALIQFAPLLIIPAICLNFHSRFSRHGDIYAVLALYVVAKIAEYFDQPLFDFTGVGGHAWKHLLAALAAFGVLRMLRLRRRLPETLPVPPALQKKQLAA